MGDQATAQAGEADHREAGKQAGAIVWGKRLQNFLIVLVVVLTITELYIAIQERGNVHVQEALRDSREALSSTAPSGQNANQSANEIDKISKEVDDSKAKTQDLESGLAGFKKGFAKLKKTVNGLENRVKSQKHANSAQPVALVATANTAVAVWVVVGGVIILVS